MSGYNVQTPSLFKVKNPQTLVDANLATLNATVRTPTMMQVIDEWYHIHC